MTIIPGSEIFDYQSNPPEIIRRKVGSRLKLHDVSKEQVESLDPLTYEVLRHRIWATTQEMGDALKRMSGSLVVSDANDFNFAVMDEVGDVVQMGPYNLGMSVALDSAVKWTLENRADNPGIEEGDMFLCNDPWVGGGLHQNDVAVFSPLFWEGEVFAWIGASAHQLDLGGVAPGSWTPRSTSVFWESLPTPPIKIVRKRQIQRDVEDVYLRRSRIPRLVALDLRAKIGANSLAQERILTVIRKYGPAVVKAVMRRMMDDAERRVCAKLRALPDGEWSTVAYQEESHEGDRGVYKIVLRMSKKKDHLTFDFTGTDPQVDGLINCPYNGLRGGIIWAVMPVLCGDIQWAAGGVMRCFDIISEAGTINHAKFPAGICKASVASAWATMNATTECLAQMLDSRPEYRKSAISGCQGTWSLAVLSGPDQYRNPFVVMLMDAIGAGLGARRDQDGVDSGGLMAIIMGRAPDVEMTELMVPVLYLWRREETDSGGPGKYRGGVGGSICIVPQDTSMPLNLVISGSGKAISINVGVEGGYAGNTLVDTVIRSSDLSKLLASGHIPSSLEEIKGAVENLPSEKETYLGLDDVYYQLWQGGGGYMDPLLRDPLLVLRDVLELRVSIAAARQLYAVEIDEAKIVVNADETRRLREQLREERRRRAKSPQTAVDREKANLKTAATRQWDENLAEVQLNGRIVLACQHCGQIICEANEPYSERLALVEGSPSESGPLVCADSERFVDTSVSLRLYCCPNCYTAFLSETVPIGEPNPRAKQLF